jgi:hypothetical protein
MDDTFTKNYLLKIRLMTWLREMVSARAVIHLLVLIVSCSERVTSHGAHALCQLTTQPNILWFTHDVNNEVGQH